MSVNKKDLYYILDIITLPEIAGHWDNAWLQIESSKNKKIGSPLLCLDCPDTVNDEAQELLKKSLIVSRYSQIFTSLLSIQGGTYPSNPVYKIIQSGISLYVMRANLNKALVRVIIYDHSKDNFQRLNSFI